MVYVKIERISNKEVFKITSAKDKNHKIKFGTDGFRGVIARDFTFESIKTVALAIGDYIRACKIEPRTAVFYDRRFMSECFARHICETLNDIGVSCILSASAVPTPALSYYVKNFDVELGIMVTASHNPFDYNGIKIKNKDGASAPGELISGIQHFIDLRSNGFENEKKEDSVIKKGETRKVDIIDNYLNNIASCIDIDLIKKFKGRLLINPMYGSQAGLFKRFTDKFSLKIESDEIFGEHNPLFPGFNPEPIAPNLSFMLETMKKNNERKPYNAGFCYDGDGDRIGAVTRSGAFVSPQLIFAILLNHLLKNKKLSGSIAKTVSVTALVSEIAEKYGITINETPIGFKYIAEMMLDKNKNILIGGEESGGIGIRTYLPERDGLYLSLMLLEVMAFENKDLDEIIDNIFYEYGKFIYDRLDLKLSEDKFNAIREKLKDKKITEINGYAVTAVNECDGYKYFLNDGSWMLFRFSGTEPVLRIYAEASVKMVKDKDKVKNLLEFAKKYLEI